MAATPRFKIINPSGEYVASCKYLEDASFLVAALGEKTRVYDGAVGPRSLLWSEGSEKSAAGDSADEFRDTCDARGRLHYLRRELRAERISAGELCELADLAPYIAPGDGELLEAAGVPEHPES